MNTTITDNILFANPGDKVKLKNGNVYEFVKLKRTKFLGKNEKGLYDIPVSAFVEIVEKAEIKVNDGYKKLRKGQLFYIDKGGNAIVFIYEEMKRGRIIARNPITGGLAQIDTSLYGGKVSELKG